MATASPESPSPVAVVRFAGHHVAPITMLFIDATVEVMLVLKDGLPLEADLIPRDAWGVVGVYVLLGPGKNGSVLRARPGWGHDVLARVRQHAASSPWFTRAIIARDTRAGWNSAEARYLEGRLHRLCRESAGVEHDFRRDKDETLQAHKKRLLDGRYLPAIVAALRLAGAPIDATTL
jgi:hypothetical protein